MANSGPGYTVEDLVFYTGLFAGIILTYFALQQFAPDTHRIVMLLVGLVVGAGLGWVFLKIFESQKRPPRGPDDDFMP